MRKLLIMLLAILLLIHVCSAEIMDSYNDYSDSMYTELMFGDYSAALEYYYQICEKWPSATARKGDIDLYGLYCEGQVALANRKYTQAISKLSVLPSDFPSNFDNMESAGVLVLYCKGQRYLEYDMVEEAKVYFEQCGGILDSALILNRLNENQDTITESQETTIQKIKIVPGSEKAQITWIDLASEMSDMYYVTYYPEKMASKAVSVQCQVCEAVISDLIPSTDYTVFITPYKDGKISGTSSSAATFATESTVGQKSVVRLNDVALYSYDKQRRDKLNMGSSRDTFFNKVIAADKSISHYYEILDNGAKVKLSASGMHMNENGYALRCKFQYLTKQHSDLEVMIVLRPAGVPSEENEKILVPTGVYSEKIQAQSNMDIGSFYVYLDDMMEDIYETNNGVWPIGPMLIEIYINGVMLCGDLYLNLADNF